MSVLILFTRSQLILLQKPVVDPVITKQKHLIDFAGGQLQEKKGENISLIVLQVIVLRKCETKSLVSLYNRTLVLKHLRIFFRSFSSSNNSGVSFLAFDCFIFHFTFCFNFQESSQSLSLFFLNDSQSLSLSFYKCVCPKYECI